jgi:nicotinate-nucleotide adenylyltransferase
VVGPAERLGVLGGTFDPPHIGHLVAGVNALHELSLDRVLLVVANRPWQKVGERSVSPAKTRLLLVQEAVRGIDGLEASDQEIIRGGDTYTFDTIDRLAAEDRELVLVLGADAAAGLRTWHRWRDLARSVEIAVVDRPGAPDGDVPEEFRHRRVPIPLLDVSSSAVRERVRSGAPIAGLVPEPVRSVIERELLYLQGE